MADDDLKTFVGEILRRNEIAFESMVARIDQGTLALIDLRADIARQSRAIADHHDETRAQTQALLRLLDRLSRGES